MLQSLVGKYHYSTKYLHTFFCNVSKCLIFPLCSIFISKIDDLWSIYLAYK